MVIFLKKVKIYKLLKVILRKLSEYLGRTYAAKGQQLRRVDDRIAPTNLVYLSGGRLIVWKRKTNLVKGNAGLQAVL